MGTFRRKAFVNPIAGNFGMESVFRWDFDWQSVLIRFWQGKCFRSDFHWESVYWPDFGRKSDFSQLFAGKVFLVRFWQRKSLLIIFHLAKWFDLIVTGEVLRLDFHWWCVSIRVCLVKCFFLNHIFTGQVFFWSAFHRKNVYWSGIGRDCFSVWFLLEKFLLLRFWKGKCFLVRCSLGSVYWSDFSRESVFRSDLHWESVSIRVWLV